MSEAKTFYDGQPAEWEDPRVDQVEKLAREIMQERARAAMDCFKAGDERAARFLRDAVQIDEVLEKFLEVLRGEY